MKRSTHERFQPDPRKDDYYTKAATEEVCKFCGRKRTTRVVTTVTYDPGRMVYAPGEHTGLIPTFPTDHLVVQNIDGQVIPSPNDPIQRPTDTQETTAGRDRGESVLPSEAIP